MIAADFLSVNENLVLKKNIFPHFEMGKVFTWWSAVVYWGQLLVLLIVWLTTIEYKFPRISIAINPEVIVEIAVAELNWIPVVDVGNETWLLSNLWTTIMCDSLDLPQIIQ